MGIGGQSCGGGFAVSLTVEAAAQLYRSRQAQLAWRGHHDCAAGIRAREMVAESSPQPEHSLHQRGAALQARGGGNQRSISLGTLVTMVRSSAFRPENQ